MEETDVPNLPLSHFYKRSNPIASYCLHLSPVLSLLEEIGSPSRSHSLLEMCEPGMMEAPLGTVWYLSSDHLLSLTEHIGLLIRRGNVFLQGFQDSHVSVDTKHAQRSLALTP